MKIKASELTGAALDWAVAKATRSEMPSVRQWMLWDDYHPTKSWTLTGPLRDKYKLDVMDFSEHEEPCVVAMYEKNNGLHSAEGQTALIAICRAVVALNLGEDVDVPDELVQGGAA